MLQVRHLSMLLEQACVACVVSLDILRSLFGGRGEGLNCMSPRTSNPLVARPTSRCSDNDVQRFRNPFAEDPTAAPHPRSLFAFPGLQLRQLRNDVSVAGKSAYRWMFGPPATEAAPSTSEEKPTAAPQEQRPFSRGASMVGKTDREDLTALERRKRNGAEASASPPLPVCPVLQNGNKLEREM